MITDLDYSKMNSATVLIETVQIQVAGSPCFEQTDMQLYLSRAWDLLRNRLIKQWAVYEPTLARATIMSLEVFSNRQSDPVTGRQWMRGCYWSNRQRYQVLAVRKNRCWLGPAFSAQPSSKGDCHLIPNRRGHTSDVKARLVREILSRIKPGSDSGSGSPFTDYRNKVSFEPSALTFSQHQPTGRPPRGGHAQFPRKYRPN